MISFDSSSIYSSLPIKKASSVAQYNPVDKAFTSSDKSGGSSITPLRDGLISMINRGEDTAKELLKYQKIPTFGGLMLGKLPDLSDTEALARRDRITEKFVQEHSKYEQQKFSLIRKGESEGKSATEIMFDIVELHDSQSELFNLGTAWSGDVFAFDKSSPEGYQRAINHSKDVVNTYA
ncbi:MAG: hypothetical protein OEM38_11430 [Gammaproteobacteria bacterium]|nr:hypothetical protein [Gammaproteobacteria bacterium]